MGKRNRRLGSANIVIHVLVLLKYIDIGYNTINEIEKPSYDNHLSLQQLYIEGVTRIY